LKGLCGKMILKIHKKTEYRVFKVYLLAMFALFVVRYLLKVNVPAIVFLMVTMLPIWWGSTTEQLALAVSCIPFSVAFQYKYALLILSVAMLIRNRWRLKRSGVFIIVMVMMAWELWHAFYGWFSFVEYLRDFAELILLGVVTSINVRDVDHKLVIRSLTVSVVGVCAIMLIMQLQQFNFNLLAVFARSARSFRFGQSNMEAGTYALNFNANNLGFICNLATCGGLLLIARKEHRRMDVLLAVCSVIFAVMTLSRAAIICAVMIFGTFLVMVEGKLAVKIWSGVGGLLAAVFAVVLIHIFVPSVFENIQERFQRADVWNGRGGLLVYYNQFLMSSPMYLLFGVGMQHIFEKVSPLFPVKDVPHMGLQEVVIAWGLVGLVMLGVVLWRVLVTSRRYAGGKRQLYQFMPFVLTMVFTMSGQLLTSSRALMSLSFAYICLCVEKASLKKDAVRSNDE
jgi:hypothetical protein